MKLIIQGAMNKREESLKSEYKLIRITSLKMHPFDPLIYILKIIVVIRLAIRPNSSNCKKKKKKRMEKMQGSPTLTAGLQNV